MPQDTDKDSLRLIVSGGIGAGKSTVTRLMLEAGAAVIHADEIGHLVLEPEGEAFAPVVARWPQVEVDGRVDRSKLAAIVFSDAAELTFLESITHPAIGRKIRELAELVQSRFWVLEVPVSVDFVGDGWQRVVVTADSRVRRARLIERGMDPEDIDHRMASQLADAEWMTLADHHISNNGDLVELETSVRNLIRALREEA